MTSNDAPKREPKTAKVDLYLTPTLKASLDRMAAADGLSRNGFVTQLIARAARTEGATS